MENIFLAVNKEYLGLGLKSIDILIISQIDEYQRNNRQCFVTNEQFSAMFGESKDTIKRALNKLEELNIIKRETFFIVGNGKANKNRILTLNNREKWKVQKSQWKVQIS